MRLGLEATAIQILKNMGPARGDVGVSLLLFDQVNCAWKSTLDDVGFASLVIGALESYDEHGGFISERDTQPTFDPRPFLPLPRQAVLWAVFLSRGDTLVSYLSTAERAGVVEALRMIGRVGGKDEFQ